MDEFMRDIIKGFLIDVLDESEPFDDDFEENKIVYDKNEFLEFILLYGESFYKPIYISDVKREELFDKLRSALEEIPDTEYWSIRVEGKTICMATPTYIRDGKVTVAKKLGIIPEAFEEVSGPMSSVFLLDCEKQFLRKEYLKIRGEEWLI